MRAFDARALRRLHIATDLLLVSLAWLGAYWLRFALGGVLGRPLNPFASYALAMPVIVAPWVFSCWLFGIYKSARMRTLVDHLQDLFRGVLLGLLVISAISFFFKEFEFGRLVVAFTGAISLLLQGASRVVFYRLERDLQRSGRADVPALIIGTGVSAIRLLQKLQDHPEIGYRVVGFLDELGNAAGKDVAGHPVLGALDDLREVVHKHEVGEVFVALPSLSHTRMLSLVLECEDLGLTFRIVTDLFEVLTAGTPVDLIDDLPLVRLGRTAVHPLYVPAKRAFDLVAASLGLPSAETPRIASESATVLFRYR